ncbi:MAG: hypothetical protein LUD78_10485 [Clostridiales bacterium]|nr:hypothetical protein [Clostridiales bacterium]
MLNEPELWWNEMPGPSNLVEEAAEQLLQRESVALHCAEGVIPWEEDFRISVKEKVQRRDPDFLLDAYTAPAQGDPGRWVVDQLTGGGFFCLPSEDPVQKASAQGLLKNRILWVSGIREKRQADDWLDLTQRMKRVPPRQRGCVVLLLPSGLPGRSWLAELDMEAFVGEYDLHFFAETLTSRRRMPRFEKKYLAELAVALSQGDPGRCARFTAMGRRLVEAPEALEMGMDHADRHHAVWLAQMRVVFAKIEETKFAILQRNQAAVSDLVGDRDDFENYIVEIGDIELRHLIHASKNGRLWLPAEDWQTVQILYANRNQLAHHHTLSFQELEELNERLL